MSKTEDRIVALEVGRTRLDQSLNNIDERLIKVEHQLGNHIQHLTQTLKFLVSRNWLGLIVEGSILTSSLVTLYITIFHK